MQSHHTCFCLLGINIIISLKYTHVPQALNRAMSGESPERPRVAEPFLIDRVVSPQPFVSPEPEFFNEVFTMTAAATFRPTIFNSMVIDRFETPVYFVPLKPELVAPPIPIEFVQRVFPVNETTTVPENSSRLNIATESALDLQNGNYLNQSNETLLPSNLSTFNSGRPEELDDSWLPNRNYTQITDNYTSTSVLESSPLSVFLHSNLTTTSVMKAITPSTPTSQLCGFPSFCSSNALYDCADIALKACQQCNMAGASIFVALIVLLGLLIVMGNGFVIWCNMTKKSGFSGTYSKIKASLAVADMLTGIQIFGIAIYNFSWTLNSTANELDRHQLQLRGSPQSIAGGIFHVFGFTASLYHLIFLGQQRFCAIKWPMRYRSQRNRNVYVGLITVWGMAVLMSVVPTFFPSVYTYTYSHPIFLFNITMKEITLSQDLGPLALIFTFLFIVPYVIMTALTVASGAILRSYKKGSRDLSQRQEAHKIEKRETAVYKMLAIMQIGFTITLVPLLVVVVLNYTGALTCETISTPLIVCVYLSMSNSLVNVIVYGFMDKNFRSAFVEGVPSCFQKHPPVQKTSTGPNQQASKCSTNTTKLQGSLATHSV